MTAEILLRDVVEEDLPVLFEQQLDSDATWMAAFPSRDRDAFMAHWEGKILGNAAVIAKTILLDGEIAGNIVCFELDGTPLVGYWIGKEFWGKGVATRALRELLGQVTTRPMHAHVARHNVGSIRVLEKCGFRVLREEKVTVLGEELEELVMGLGVSAGDAQG
jgi:RimJ/RimL family protein N-acetyltransferase